MNGDDSSGLLNSAIKLAHDCWDQECNGQIVVTLGQFMSNYYAPCPECRKSIVFGRLDGTYVEVLEWLIIGGLEGRGWTVIPSR